MNALYTIFINKIFHFKDSPCYFLINFLVHLPSLGLLSVVLFVSRHQQPLFFRSPYHANGFGNCIHHTRNKKLIF